MNVKIVPGAWERLNLICDAIESADPALKRKSELRSNRMLARQERAFASIMKRPNSKAYRDYVLVP